MICDVCTDRDELDPERAPDWLRGLLEIRPSCLPCAEAFATQWAQGYERCRHARRRRGR